MTELRTAAFEPERLEAVLGLMEKVYGTAPPRAEFEWWFDGNPVGPRTVVLALDGADVVGVLGASFYRAVVLGEERLVALPLWAATDPDFQGRGIFQRLNDEIEREAREAGATVELGFTNKLAGPIYIAKLGWLDVHRLRIWARPLVPFGRRDVDGHRHRHRFDIEQEAMYIAIASRLPSHFVRNTAYLNWRYADSPRDYTTILSRNGYAVVGRKRFKGIDTAYVADLVAPTVREALWLLRRCARAARGARVLLALPSFQPRAFAAFGFMPTPMTIRLIGHSLRGPLPVGAGAWSFTLGDTDYF